MAPRFLRAASAIPRSGVPFATIGVRSPEFGYVEVMDDVMPDDPPEPMLPNEPDEPLLPDDPDEPLLPTDPPGKVVPTDPEVQPPLAPA
jgi:hypothetical protein